MKNAIDPLPANVSGRITCGYLNSTAGLQVVRITNIPNWYFERVVFPGQQLVFQAFPEALLEIHTCEMVTTILADRIPCTSLRCAEYLELPVKNSAHQTIAR
ncbi:DUF1830 domain-containing protein [Leptolyngbya cf. ectocarpi LEGE 11479]|uniref:DUF1830 domain-containing protein n=1 Tax=Leptolyngbya cf. ectocarpi LEGE 11479 TaxID=1828722 RepID=A0A929F9T3_LEPEC|nr:DUF1830 domain-containing protein [Leptolyngbya ectocarpi]MBE9069546.1 DUF1830 domain-containing protein [Leptolyngbya cf. ectocarpi LEGE 11479]